MNCREAEALILAARDVSSQTPRPEALAGHLESCPACRRLAKAVEDAGEGLRRSAAEVAVPDVTVEWMEIRQHILEEKRSGRAARPGRRSPLAWLAWVGAPLAAAAAVFVAVLFLAPARSDAGPTAEVARVEYLEIGDDSATPVVYVDEESGWLVVWTVSEPGEPSGT